MQLLARKKPATIRPREKPWMALMIRISMLRKKAHKSCKDSDRFMFRKFENKANNMKKYANSKYYEIFDSCTFR